MRDMGRVGPNLVTIGAVATLAGLVVWVAGGPTVVAWLGVVVLVAGLTVRGAYRQQQMRD